MESPAQETVIRVAERCDSKGILRCLAAAFEPYRMQYSAEAFSETTLNADTLAERMRHMHILVATFNGQVVGTVSASCNEEEGHLRGMAVTPEFCGAGLASRLLRDIEGWV